MWSPRGTATRTSVQQRSSWGAPPGNIFFSQRPGLVPDVQWLRNILAQFPQGVSKRRARCYTHTHPNLPKYCMFCKRMPTHNLCIFANSKSDMAKMLYIIFAVQLQLQDHMPKIGKYCRNISYFGAWRSFFGIPDLHWVRLSKIWAYYCQIHALFLAKCAHIFQCCFSFVLCSCFCWAGAGLLKQRRSIHGNGCVSQSFTKLVFLGLDPVLGLTTYVGIYFISAFWGGGGTGKMGWTIRKLSFELSPDLLLLSVRTSSSCDWCPSGFGNVTPPQNDLK